MMAKLTYPELMGPQAVKAIKAAMGPRMASLVALTVLLGTGIAFQSSTPLQEEFFGGLSDVAKAAVLDLSLTNLVLGGFAFAAWLTCALVVGMAVFSICLLVEIVMDGPPKSWRATLTASAIQLAVLAYMILLNPFVARVLPDQWGLQSILSITEADLPNWLMPASPVVLAVLSLFIFNFSQYWAHRAQHAIPWLWKFHAVHHSVRDMDSMNSFTHPVDSVVWQMARSTLLVFIVIDFDMLLWIGGIILIHDRFLHTRSNVNFGVFKDLLVDNRHHFVHHSRDPRDFDKNFSAWFTVWDRVFGTYAPPRDVSLVTTGLDDLRPPQTLWQFFSGRLERESVPGCRGTPLEPRSHRQGSPGPGGFGRDAGRCSSAGSTAGGARRR